MVWRYLPENRSNGSSAAMFIHEEEVSIEKNLEHRVKGQGEPGGSWRRTVLVLGIQSIAAAQVQTSINES